MANSLQAAVVIPMLDEEQFAARVPTLTRSQIPTLTQLCVNQLAEQYQQSTCSVAKSGIAQAIPVQLVHFFIEATETRLLASMCAMIEDTAQELYNELRWNHPCLHLAEDLFDFSENPRKRIREYDEEQRQRAAQKQRKTITSI
jgi:hypothetical protein